VPLDQVAGKTDTLIRLGADLAATYGGTTQQAVEALGSAMRGETDPIEKYGVSVKQADIAAKQAADGTDKLTGAAGKQAKTAALLALITEQSADAQGQFAEESDTAAVQAQKTAAKYEDMQAALGEALLPAITKVVEWLGKLVKMMTEHKTVTLVVIGIIAALAAGILILNVALGIYTAVTTLAASTTLAAWAAAALPITLVIAAVLLLVGAVVLLWKKSDTFRTVVLAVWSAIKTAALSTARAIKTAWLAIWRALSTAAKAMATAVKAVWTAIKTAAIAAWGKVKEAVTNVITKITTLIQKVKDIKVPGAIKTAFDNIKSAGDKVLTLVKDLIEWIKKIPIPHINWPDPPGWLDKVLPGGHLTQPAGVAPSGVPLGRYVAPTGRSGRLASRAGTSAAAPTIVIQGALDPEGVARQIQRILGGHNRRMGGAAA
jgi:hypothetical protein